jgi:hypothetical protein
MVEPERNNNFFDLPNTSNSKQTAALADEFKICIL